MRAGLFVGFVIAGLTVAGATETAHADITAEYIGENERERVVIEIADNGDMRITDGADEAVGYMLFVGDNAYSVEPGPGGPLVTSSEVKAYETRRGVEAGAIEFSIYGEDEPPTFLRFVPGEPIELAGFHGAEYVAEQGLYLPVGIADDAALAPLGQAYLRYERAIDEMSAGFGTVPDNLGDLLATRGVMRFWGRDLARVSFEPIDPIRFALPAEPLLMEDILKNEADPSSAKEDGEFNSIVHAIYLEGTLWTLTRDNKLSRWAEGAESGVAVDTPGPVGAICRLGDELLIVTGDIEGTGTVKLWSGAPGGWREEATYWQGREDPFVALDCGGDEPLLLTARALYLPRSEKRVPIETKLLAPGGYFTTLRHGGYLYVGVNAGEWGGGLRRFSLADGEGEALDASNPDDLCGGALNMGCDPVTGLAPDPKQPDCILASVGLVHFNPSGHVARICERQIAIAYSKPFTLDPDWEAKPPVVDAPFASVPFYSMSSIDGVILAVASDGIYGFAAGGNPTFVPFGRTRKPPASGIDWSDPRFVLILTDMNQRHSISGGSLLLVPR